MVRPRRPASRPHNAGVTRYCVEFDWKRVGAVTLDTSGALKFLLVPKAVGLH
jgi:hypothetical protein